MANIAYNLSGDTSRVIIHFDYDCFYCAVHEVENPALKHIPFAVQQKHIIVTCNYEARRRGLYKLQLVTDARRTCPDVVIRLGEDLDPFRAASKRLCNFLVECNWSGHAERLGFDEVWLDVTDMVTFNAALTNEDPQRSFFRLDHEDASKGFTYDATTYAGHTYPPDIVPQYLDREGIDPLSASLQMAEKHMILGSHLARYLRHQLAEQTHFTATVGVSVNKTLSKLVGNVHKPDGQTTLVPPYFVDANHAGMFMDQHDIGKVPGIGFKTAQALRQAVLGREASFDTGLVYGGTKEQVRVQDVRCLPGMNAERLAEVLAGPGVPRDLGARVWRLLHGIDDAPVASARSIPRQISIEDSYLQLDTWAGIRQQLVRLTTRLVERMRHELLSSSSSTSSEAVDSGQRQQQQQQQQHNEDTAADVGNRAAAQRGARRGAVWLARPQTLRLSTRARPPQGPDGMRMRSFKRVSKSGPMPSWVCAGNADRSSASASASASFSAAAVAERLVATALVPMFRALHPDRTGVDLTLINVAATNMVETPMAGGRGASGQDIGGMFRRAQAVHAETETATAQVQGVAMGDRCSDDDRRLLEHSTGRVESQDLPDARARAYVHAWVRGSEDMLPLTQESEWDPGAGASASADNDAKIGAGMGMEMGWHEASDDEEEGGELGLGAASSEASTLAGPRGETCPLCAAQMPAFAMVAHLRYHEAED